MPPKGKNKIRLIEYDSSNHFRILFQMYGSVWFKVIPYCLLNVLLSVLILYLKKVQHFDMTMSPIGHRFMGIVVSFLIVSRVSIVLSRVNEAATHLSNTYKSTQELSQHITAFTYYEKYKEAQDWRADVAYHAMLLLRVTMAVINYQSSNKNAWEVPELDAQEKRFLRRNLMIKGADRMECSVHQDEWAHGERTDRDENLRVPIRMAFRLRKIIISHRQRLTNKLSILEELKLLSFVENFMNGYYGLQKLVSNPFPFPLIQMTRTFLFFFVYTLPFALLSVVPDGEYSMKMVAVIAITTYGFLGLEYISIEYDDPFGDDPNDFDNLGHAKIVFEDIYMTINDCDGPIYADILRGKMSTRDATKSVLDHNYNPRKAFVERTSYALLKGLSNISTGTDSVV